MNISTEELYGINPKVIKTMNHYHALQYLKVNIPAATVRLVNRQKKAETEEEYSYCNDMIKRLVEADKWLAKRIEEME